MSVSLLREYKPLSSPHVACLKEKTIHNAHSLGDFGTRSLVRLCMFLALLGIQTIWYCFQARVSTNALQISSA